ncbi:MAG: hypothetical protein Q4G58_08180 [bacterium]|nr:hypothetical protein [bacterium]
MLQSSWLEDPIVKKMDGRKVQVIKKLMKETEGKPMAQCFTALMGANNTLQSQGLSFNREETKTLINLMTANMNPKEQAQAQMIMNFMSSMKK